MRIAVIGGGPGGLYLAALVKQVDPGHEVVVWERNAAGDTFGFGVVFSDETLDGIEHADTVVHAQMAERFARWGNIDVDFRAATITSGGHGFAAMERRALLAILQRRCRDLGVDMRHQPVSPDPEHLRAAYDLVVAADGVNSVTRDRYANVFAPTVHTGGNQYIWLGTDRVFDAFTFVIAETPYGVMQLHTYPYSATASTLIAEMPTDVWSRAGFGPELLAVGSRIGSA